jgi:hypothetical protein
MNTDFPHLDLADLIGEATGQEADGRVLEHLASCGDCRAEANRWNLVADGVRGLAAATPEVAPPARPRHSRRHVLADPRRRNVLAAGAAAALVVLGGGGYGAAAALTGHAPSSAGAAARAAVLTAVGGCAGLKQASGTLEQVRGDSLVIETPGGRPVTVATTASTMLSVMSGAPLSDITDGAPVTVMGSSSDGAIAATNVTVGQTKPEPGGPTKSDSGSVVKTKSDSGRVVKPEPKSGKGIVGTTQPGPNGIVQGTVADADAVGFTVVTSSGTRVPVTTSGDTLVSVLRASLGQLRAGATTVAVGYVEPDGRLSATVVMQPPSKKPGSGKLHPTIAVNGCSPASIDNALTTAFVSGD